MSYRIGVSEPIDLALSRILQEEVSKALSHVRLIDERPKAVHEARKSLKRMRALLVLLRPLDRDKDIRNAEKQVRSVARGLSTMRDSYVVCEAAALLEKNAHIGNRQLLRDVRSWLQARRDKAQHKLDPSHVQSAIAELKSLENTLADIKFKNASIDALLSSAQNTYRKGRAAMAVALAHENEEEMHEWRKLVQAHWRHMRLLGDAWAEESKARVELARELSEVLGVHHDLAILRQTILANKLVFVDASDIEMLCDAIDVQQRQRALRATTLAERLYAEKPKPFLKRWSVYWQASRQAST